METDRTMASALFQNGSFHRMQSGTVCLCNERNRGNRRIRQIPIFLTKSEIPLNFWKLLVIFLERTIIAIPLIVLFANMIGL